MPPVRLVATDLDGTLLGPDAELSSRTAAALRDAHAAGIVVVAATGRSYLTATLRLAAATTVRWLVCSNGAVLYDRQTAAVVDRHGIDAAAVPAAVEAIRAGVPEVGFAWESAAGLGAEEGFLVMAPTRDSRPDEVIDRLGPPYPDGLTKLMVGHPDLRRGRAAHRGAPVRGGRAGGLGVVGAVHRDRRARHRQGVRRRPAVRTAGHRPLGGGGPG